MLIKLFVLNQNPKALYYVLNLLGTSCSVCQSAQTSHTLCSLATGCEQKSANILYPAQQDKTWKHLWTILMLRSPLSSLSF